MSEQPVLKFQISLRETFSNSISLRFREKHDKSFVVQISGPFSLLNFEWCSKTAVLRHLSNHVFRSP